MKQRHNKLTALLLEKKGSGEYVGALLAMLALLALTVVLIAGFKLINTYTTLNTFGDQLVSTMAKEGRCMETGAIQRYESLSRTTGLDPFVTYEADYYNAGDMTVQYGDTIKMTLTLDTELSAMGISIPVTLTITKTAKSEQYWK